jgi:histidine triad (HIT) family protein
MDCLFCKIIAGEIPSTKVYEDDKILAFKDLNPQAPVHVLVIPKMHMDSIEDITEETSREIAYIFENIPLIASCAGIRNGYRVVSNCGPDGCQTVHHLHFHILGGGKLGEKLA